jgi:hypothetical protein
MWFLAYIELDRFSQMHFIVREILGPHGGERENGYLLKCCAK